MPILSLALLFSQKRWNSKMQIVTTLVAQEWALQITFNGKINKFNMKSDMAIIKFKDMVDKIKIKIQ